MNLLEVDTQHLERILAQIRSGQVAVSGQGRAYGHLLRSIADVLGDDAIFVRVERALDAAPYVALAIASQCGPDVLARTAECLADREAPADAWQGALAPALGGRYLLVEGLDRLRVSGPEWDLAGLSSSTFQSLDAWLTSRAAITSHAHTPRVEMRPREDKLPSSKELWTCVERDPDRYALAVAREILLGPTVDDEERGWDSGSLVRDLWECMPSETRELIAFLAVHGRPVSRASFERLALVPGGAIDRARDFGLVEIHRGQLSLPSPWYDATVWLDSVQRHRALADAFAALASVGGGEANPLAVLEAHRHYAAIPDHRRALSLARFGAGALLDTAVRQSLRRERAEAAQTYEALLQLDERIVSAQRVEGLGKRTRAYVRHYLHYNRYLADCEPLADTIAGYRMALSDWPENALFWSRLVRALFVAQDESRAMSTLHEAYLAVPRHPERDRVLIVRTVDRLLFRDLVLPAVFVWGEYQSRGPLDIALEGRLDAQLREGWEVKRLWADGLPAIDLAAPVTMRLAMTESGSICFAGDLRRTARTRAEAIRACVRALLVDELVARWRRETGGLSVQSVRYQHPAMQQILAMGRDVVPEILRHIEKKPDHWHVALVRLTGENPIPAGEKVTVSEACARWVMWGRAREFSW